MDIFMERYADVIIRRALRLRKGDVLSINTEDENNGFAHLIAKKAKEITGNGTYILNIENGRIAGTEEAESEYPIEKKATALLYLPVYKEYMVAESGRVYTAPEIQRFRHLSDPLDIPEPSVPFAVAPVPSESWGRTLDDESGISLPASLISDLLSLGEDDYLEAGKDDEDVLLYERERLASLSITRCRIQDEEGTDIEFSFLPGSEFMTTIQRLRDGRLFIPTIFSSEIFRAIEKTSAEGYITATRPFMLFGRLVRSLSLRFEKGRVTDFSADERTTGLFRLYLEQDQNAGVLSELSIAEESNPASLIDCFALPEWDRMRGISLTIGGPRPESLKTDAARSSANDSLVTLSIPIGSDSTVITAELEDGSIYTIAEDGFIKEE